MDHYIWENSNFKHILELKKIKLLIAINQDLLNPCNEENNVLVINILIQGKPLNAVDKRVYNGGCLSIDF